VSYVPTSSDLQEFGLSSGTVEVFAVTECDVTSSGDWNPTFRDNVVLSKG